MSNNLLKAVRTFSGIVCAAGVAILAISVAPMLSIPTGLINIAYGCAGGGGAVLILASLYAENSPYSTTEFENNGLQLQETSRELRLSHAEKSSELVVMTLQERQKIEEKISNQDSRIQTLESKLDLYHEQMQALIRNQCAQQVHQNRSEIRRRSFFQQEAPNTPGINLQPAPPFTSLKND